MFNCSYSFKMLMSRIARCAGELGGEGGGEYGVLAPQFVSTAAQHPDDNLFDEDAGITPELKRLVQKVLICGQGHSQGGPFCRLQGLLC